MKKREVILDFTSLLDVTLIVIFFFVLFSHLDSEENKAKTEAKVNELEAEIQLAEDREEEANKLIMQKKEEIQIVRDSNKRQGSNVNEMIEFDRGRNLKLILNFVETGWTIRIIQNNSVVEEINSQSFSADALLAAIQRTEYEGEDTIFCDFVFNGSVPGSASAYRAITKGLDEVKKEYRYLYYSETDLSIGED